MSTKKSGKIKIQQASDGNWYFTTNATNGRVLTTSQRYPSHRACVKGVDALKRMMENPTVEND